MRRAAATPVVQLLALFTVAAGYFALGCRLTLEWADEGPLVYDSWRVAEGAIPYRDILHVYAPSVFFLNGLLFRLFGPQLLVVRASLVLCKAVLAVLVYLSARRLAAPPFALAAYAFFVAVWAAPAWVFNMPWAGQYSLIAILCALLLFCRQHQRRPLAACAVAGVCFGVAATFKQTTGAFAFASFLLYVLYADLPGASRAAGSVVERVADGAARLARFGALFAALGLFIAYLWPRNTAWNVALLFTPLGLAIGLLFVRELRRPLDAASRIRSVAGMLCCGSAMMVPIAGYALWYWRWGLLYELLFNTASGLPQLMTWFVPVPSPDVRTLLGASALLTAFVAVRVWRTGVGGGRTSHRRALLVAPLLALAAALLVREVANEGGLLTWARGGAWQGDVLRLYFFLPFVAVWGALQSLIVAERAGATAVTSPAPAPTSRRSELALFGAWGASSLLSLYPAGDFWHVVMAMPAFLPLLAHQLERFHRVDRACTTEPGSVVSATFLIAVLGLLASPLVLSLATTASLLWAKTPAFARAAGIVSVSDDYAPAAALVGYLDAEQPPSRKLLIIANQQMLYYLAGRVSAAEREEFVFWLVGAEVVADDDARKLAPEAGLIERLAAERPILVDFDGSPGSRSFRRVFPRVAAYLDAHYRPIRSFGKYRVLDWASE